MCCSPLTGLYMVLVAESAYLGAAWTIVLYSGYLVTSPFVLDDAYLSREWFFALFFSLLPISCIHLCVLFTLIKAVRVSGPGWLLPYVLWRMFLSLGMAVGMVMVAVTPWERAADRRFLSVFFSPLVLSILIGVWSLLTVLRLRSRWIKLRRLDVYSNTWEPHHVPTTASYRSQVPSYGPTYSVPYCFYYYP